jgi:hypothetical protein
LRDHSHFSPDDSGICAHCGQPLPVAAAPSFGRRGVNRVGLGVTVALHLLLVLIYLFKPEVEKSAPPPSGATMVYLAPLKDGKPKKPAQESAPKPKKQVKAAPPLIERLPDTITLPEEKPVPVAKEAPKKAEQPVEVDMSAYIEARRRARGAASPGEQPEEESADARALRIAKANIAAANGRSAGDDKNETGGVFSLNNKTFASAELKFRGWNPNFKRRWLQQVTVELGTEPDIETAIVKKMIELIRKEKTGDFDWDSQRLQRVVKMSARVQDTEELQAFLYLEMFPAYRRAPPRR